MSIPVLQRFDLAGRTAVITGTGGDLCDATADALASIFGILHIDQATGKLLSLTRKVIVRTPMVRCDCADHKRDI